MLLYHYKESVAELRSVTDGNNVTDTKPVLQKPQPSVIWVFYLKEGEDNRRKTNV